VAALGEVVHAGALEVLLSHVKEAVQALPAMAEWAKEEESGSGTCPGCSSGESSSMDARQLKWGGLCTWRAGAPSAARSC